MSVINTNSLSLVAQGNLSKSQGALGQAIERLSSGLRINSAKDDAAGQAIANRFTANIKGLTQAGRNANDGISIAQTTEGALNEINNNLQRVRELTVQAANGTNSASDLKSIQEEIDQRLDEIDRVSEQTQFNGVKVLAKGAAKLDIQVGANDGQTISIGLEEISSETLRLDKFQVQEKTNLGTTLADGNTIFAGKTFRVDSFTTTGTAGTKTIDNEVYAKTDGSGYVVKGTTDGSTEAFYAATINAETGAVSADFDTAVLVGDVNVAGGEVKTGKLSVTLSGATAGIQYKEVLDKDNKGTGAYVGFNPTTNEYKEAYISTTGVISDGSATTVVLTDPTDDPLKAVDAALAKVDALRSDLGAVQNRFQSTIANLSNTVNNLSAARSRIEDADYAVEVSNMTRAQILQQAGTSVLAQANQVPQTVLSLLR